MPADETALPPTAGTRLLRVFAWAVIGVMFAYLVNNYLTVWRDWPGAAAVAFGRLDSLVAAQAAIYAIGVGVGVVRVWMTPDMALRTDGERISGMVQFMIRAAFWAVLLIGIVDAAISFLRVEGLLTGIVGADLSSAMDFSQSRGPIVHFPLILAGVVLAAFTRGMLAVHWLALLVVLSELSIVFSRFIFSYEQAFMGDLVRFWYGALWLFASAYTLAEDGHVRVDVLYSRFSDRARARVNAIGAVLLGMVFCWVILVMGLGTKSSIINAPLVSFEISQSGFGMYVKYLMAGFLGVFAISMLMQFCAQLLISVADWRGDPGSHLHDHDGEIPVA